MDMMARLRMGCKLLKFHPFDMGIIDGPESMWSQLRGRVLNFISLPVHFTVQEEHFSNCETVSNMML